MPPHFKHCLLPWCVHSTKMLKINCSQWRLWISCRFLNIATATWSHIILFISAKGACFLCFLLLSVSRPRDTSQTSPRDWGEAERVGTPFPLLYRSRWSVSGAKARWHRGLPGNPACHVPPTHTHHRLTHTSTHRLKMPRSTHKYLKSKNITSFP